MQHLVENLSEHHGQYSWERNTGVRQIQRLISMDRTFERLLPGHVYSHDQFKEDERT